MSRWWNEGTKQELLRRARLAAEAAYCPYSKFRVGASALLINDKEQHIFASGCNVENASYGLTICAERCAIFDGISFGYAKLVAIGICCPSWQKGMSISLSVPCGACRQVMAEFAIDLERMPIYIDGVGDPTLGELLPTPFQLK